ncbi:MAG: glucose-6-phosphate isomerase family protein [Methanobacteriota archaeon]
MDGEMGGNLPKLEFGAFDVTPDVRRIMDLEPVALFPEAVLGKEGPAYFMYRDLALDEAQRGAIHGHHLRYDITVIPSGTIGKELIKTSGHYHPDAAEGVSWPEMYQVLEGTAHYVCQKKEGGKVSDAVVIEADAGDIVLIPPNWGHVTINPTDKPLKMANWVCRDFSSDYGDYVTKRGGVWHELEGGEWKPNENYGKVLSLRKANPFDPEKLGLKTGEDMFELANRGELDKLAFLVRPQDHLDAFEGVL